MSGSSSTTSTRCSRAAAAPLRPLHGADACRQRIRKCAPCMSSTYSSAAPLRGAQLARDVEAEPGALAVGGEERLEHLACDRLRDARAVVDHVQFYLIGRRRSATMRTLPARCARVAPGVAQQVPQHLVAGARGRTAPRARGAHLARRCASARHRLVGAELLDEAPRSNALERRSPRGCARSRRLSCSTSCTMRSRRCVLSWMMRVQPRAGRRRARSSSSSSAAWLIADSGLRISCAMLAVSRPSAASFSCCASSRERVMSSRNSTASCSAAPVSIRRRRRPRPRRSQLGLRGRRRRRSRQARQRSPKPGSRRASSAPSSAPAPSRRCACGLCWRRGRRGRAPARHPACPAITSWLTRSCVCERAAALARQAFVGGHALRQPAGDARRWRNSRSRAAPAAGNSASGAS